MNQHPQPTPAELVPLLAQARRRYHAATQFGHTALAARYERLYNRLFERRRRALLAQAAQHERLS